MNSLCSKLMPFVIISNFHWIGQTHQLIAESVHYESVMFYSTRPSCICLAVVSSWGGASGATVIKLFTAVSYDFS